jgi:hypothetical protein
METKICSKCKKIKDVEEFNKRKDSKDGLSYWCKECFAKQHKLTYTNKKEEISNYHKKYYIKNYDKLKDKRILDKDKTKIRHKEYYLKNKEYVQLKTKEYDNKNKDKMKLAHHNYYLNHIKKLRDKNKEWAKNNPEKIKLSRTKYYLTQKDTLKYKISKAIRGIIYWSVKEKKNGRHWETLVGYTLQELMQHLEKQFTEGMTWNNYGKRGWEIDHKIPHSLWQYGSYEDREFKQCWCLANLQPMWGTENRKKYNKCA